MNGVHNWRHTHSADERNRAQVSKKKHHLTAACVATEMSHYDYKIIIIFNECLRACVRVSVLHRTKSKNKCLTFVQKANPNKQLSWTDFYPLSRLNQFNLIRFDLIFIVKFCGKCLCCKILSKFALTIDTLYMCGANRGTNMWPDPIRFIHPLDMNIQHGFLGTLNASIIYVRRNLFRRKW